MTDKLDTVMPKVARLLRMLTSSAEGEVLSAVHALLHVLAGAGLDIHALVERIEKSLSPSKIQKIRDAAYAEGLAAGVEQGRRSAGLAQPMGIFAGGLDSGLNGYSLQDIARHCARNAHRLNARERGFVESVARQQHYSAAQAEWLRDILRKKFAGRIE